MRKIEESLRSYDTPGGRAALNRETGQKMTSEAATRQETIMQLKPEEKECVR
jgi:hypothetical protein